MPNISVSIQASKFVGQSHKQCHPVITNNLWLTHDNI